MESSQSQNRRVTYRLYPNQVQEAEMLKIRALHQQLYNAALEQRITAFRRCGVSLNFAQQCKDLTDLRQAMPEYDALNAQSCQVTARLSPSVQLLTSLTAAVLKRLDHAFQHFFRRVKENAEKVGFPRFKPLQRYSGWGSGSRRRVYELYGWRQHRLKPMEMAGDCSLKKRNMAASNFQEWGIFECGDKPERLVHRKPWICGSRRRDPEPYG